jgi:hypothetical protein
MNMALYMFEKYIWKRGAINFMAHAQRYNKTKYI